MVMRAGPLKERPSGRYRVIISRGGSIRSVSLPSGLMWLIAALAPLWLAIGLAGAVDLVVQDRPFREGTVRDPTIETVRAGAAETEICAERAERQAFLDRAAFDDELRDLTAREAWLERRAAVVTALAAEAAGGAAGSAPASPRTGSEALTAIEQLSPRPTGDSHAPELGAGAARAYAPGSGVTVAPRVGPLSQEERGEGPPVRSTPAASGAVPDARTRLDILRHSLNRVESDQMTSLAALDRSASQSSAKTAAIIAQTGLDPTSLTASSGGEGVGGPYVPVETAPGAPAFDRAAVRVGRDVALARRLKALIPFIPLRKPLVGEAILTSPFGYRIDPFLGKLALHSGVDLLQAYGSEIRATAAGRVVYAGSMGGYGAMVEVDHGNGLSTRYGHLSEIVVKEGQEVEEGAILGRLGSSGRSTGPHLHYEVRVDGEPVDPERFLRAGEQMTAAE